MIIPNGYAQCNLLFTGDAVPRGAQVVFGVKLDATTPTPTGVGGVVATAWSAYPLQRQCQLVTFSGVRVKFGPNATGLDVFVPAGDEGGQNEPPMTPQCTLLVRKNSGSGGRANRGRMFIPGIPEAEANGAGVVSTAAQSAWNGLLQNFYMDLVAADYPMVLLHATAGVTPTLVTSLITQPLIATQRRRLRKVGGRRRAE